MTEIIVAISLFCGASASECKKELVTCVFKDRKQADSKEYLEKKLVSCLERKK